MRRQLARAAAVLAAVAALSGTALAPTQVQPAYAQTSSTVPSYGHYFQETSQAVGGTFWRFWNATGGLKRHGFPVSQEMSEKSDVDGRNVTVQYFERSAFEYRPGSRNNYNTQLINVGSYVYKQKYPRGATGQTPNNSRGSVVVRATGKRIGGRFLDYYKRNGADTLLGYPISDEFNERSSVDGKTYRVQYFEKIVLEYHPENRAPDDVLAALAGKARYEHKFLSNVRGPTGDPDGDGITGDDDFCAKAPENKNGVFDTDGCPDTMQTLLIFAAEDIDGFWAETFKASGVRYRAPMDFVPYTSPIRTACGSALLDNAFYCSRSHGIYYDYNFLYDQLQSDGDFAPVVILAHEWGHLVQANLGLLDGRYYTIQTELQADCFAGAWSAHAGRQGYLEEGDLEEGASALFRAGDSSDYPWFDENAHGQPEQRAQAFQVGVEQGVGGCTIEE